MKQEPLNINIYSDSESESDPPDMKQQSLPEPPPKRIRLLSAERCQEHASQAGSSSQAKMQDGASSEGSGQDRPWQQLDNPGYSGRVKLSKADKGSSSSKGEPATGPRKLPLRLRLQPPPPIRSRPITEVEKKCLDYLNDLTDQMQAASFTTAMQGPVPRPSQHLMRKLAKVITLSGRKWEDALQAPSEHRIWSGQLEEHMWRFPLYLGTPAGFITARTARCHRGRAIHGTSAHGIANIIKEGVVNPAIWYEKGDPTPHSDRFRTTGFYALGTMCDSSDDLNRIAVRCRRGTKNFCGLAIETVTVGGRLAIDSGGVEKEQKAFAEDPDLAMIHNRREKHYVLRSAMSKVRAVWIIGKYSTQPLDETSDEV